MKTNSNLSRRQFIKLSAFGTAGAYFFKGDGFFQPSGILSPNSANAISPLSTIRGRFESAGFEGDEFTRPHGILWDIDGYVRSKGGRPSEFTHESVVVIGGGMSGLLSSYLLREHSPLLLEQATHLGGNSKGGKFSASNDNTANSFSIGAAYITKPRAPGGSEEPKATDVGQILRDLGLDKKYRLDDLADTKVVYKTLGLKRFWQGETDPAAEKSFSKVLSELTRINEKAFPDIPWTKDSQLTQEQFTALDSESAEAWLKRSFADLHPHVEEYFQLYSWSSFGGSLNELSAAQFLNFAAAETDGVISFPGGNAAIAEALMQKTFFSSTSKGKVQTSAIVLEIKNTSSGVEVLYEDANRTLRLIRAKVAIVAAPKFVGRYIVKDLPVEQKNAWASINYRAYAVANVLLKTKKSYDSFDLFCLNGQVPKPPSFTRPNTQPWTDIVEADWSNHHRGTRSILTIYKPYPYDGARNTLYSDLALEKIKKEINMELPKFLPTIGHSTYDIEDLRVARWGHALPLARIGWASNGMLEKIHAPHGKVAFANQDCLLNPAFESCLARAAEAATFARKQLV